MGVLRMRFVGARLRDRFKRFRQRCSRKDDLDFFGGDLFLAGAVAAAGEVFELFVDALAGLFHVLQAELVFAAAARRRAQPRRIEKLVDQRCV